MFKLFFNLLKLIVNRERVIGFTIAVYLWLPSLLLALIVITIISQNANIVEYSASSFGIFTGSILAFIGVILAVLFGIFTLITNHNRENRNSGYLKLRQSIVNLENLNIRLKKEYIEYDVRLKRITPPLVFQNGEFFLDETNPENLVLLRAWIHDIDCLTERLNKVTMNWSGWKMNYILEDDLKDHVASSQKISERIEDQTKEFLVEFEQNMRELLYGFRRLDDATVGDTLLIRLSSVLGSLTTLIAFGIFFRLAADLNLGLKYSSNTILFDGLFLGICLLVHLFALVIFFSKWWDNIRKRDVIWLS